MNTDDITEVGAETVRRWARENGHEVGSRGHMPQTLIDAFNRRHRKKRFTNTNPMVNR